MSDRENTAFDLMDELNGRAGLFHDRIKMFDGPRARSLPRAYVNSSKMQKLLEHWLEINLQNGFNYTTFSARGGHRDLFFRLEGMLPAGLGQFRARSDQNNGNRHPV